MHGKAPARLKFCSAGITPIMLPQKKQKQKQKKNITMVAS